MMLSLFRFLVLTALIAVPLWAAQPTQLWLYVQNNLLVDRNVDELATLFARASKAGYTHVLLADSKSSKLADMDGRYFKNVDRVKKLAAENHLEIVPALFSVGYSNDLLWHDPNLIEAMPVRDLPLVVHGGAATLEAAQPLLKGGDLSDIAIWNWHDPNVVGTNGAALI